MDFDPHFLELLQADMSAYRQPRAPLPVQKYPSRTPRTQHKQPLPTLPRQSFPMKAPGGSR